MVEYGKRVTLMVTEEHAEALIAEAKRLDPVEEYVHLFSTALTIWALMQPEDVRERVWAAWAEEVAGEPLIP